MKFPHLLPCTWKKTCLILEWTWWFLWSALPALIFLIFISSYYCNHNYICLSFYIFMEGRGRGGGGVCMVSIHYHHQSFNSLTFCHPSARTLLNLRVDLMVSRIRSSLSAVVLCEDVLLYQNRNYRNNFIIDAHKLLKKKSSETQVCTIIFLFLSDFHCRVWYH